MVRRNRPSQLVDFGALLARWRPIQQLLEAGCSQAQALGEAPFSFLLQAPSYLRGRLPGPETEVLSFGTQKTFRQQQRMSKARLIITAVSLEGDSQADVARDNDTHNRVYRRSPCRLAE